VFLDYGSGVKAFLVMFRSKKVLHGKNVVFNEAVMFHKSSTVYDIIVIFDVSDDKQ
jgi:hypothetical protein